MVPFEILPWKATHMKSTLCDTFPEEFLTELFRLKIFLDLYVILMTKREPLFYTHIDNDDIVLVIVILLSWVFKIFLEIVHHKEKTLPKDRKLSRWQTQMKDTIVQSNVSTSCTLWIKISNAETLKVFHWWAWKDCRKIRTKGKTLWRWRHYRWNKYHNTWFQCRKNLPRTTRWRFQKYNCYNGCRNIDIGGYPGFQDSRNRPVWQFTSQDILYIIFFR